MFRKITLVAVTALLSTFSTESGLAQTAKPLDPAPLNLPLNQALDRRELGLDKRAWKASRPPQTVDTYVTCGSPAPPFNSINGALARLNPNGVNVVHVSGTCNENVTVQSFENLTMVASAGASINDASGGALDTLDIADTHEFSLQGFTINGAVACFEYSLCRFSGNTVQGSTGDGLAISRAEASSTGDVFQNNAGRGVAALNAATVRLIGDTLSGNAAAGAVANLGSQLTLVNVAAVNNGGPGIGVGNHSFLRLIDSTLTGNGAQGVAFAGGSEARFETLATGNVITGNNFAGVRIGDLSFVQFFGSDNITGNNLANPGGFDVVCLPQFSATRGALTGIGGGSTNCVEP